MFYPLKKIYGKPLLYQNICKEKCQTIFARRLHLNWISENMSEKMPENMPHKMQEQTNICQIERNGWETMSDWHVRIFAMVGFTRSEVIVVGSIFPKRKRTTRSEISEDKKKQTQQGKNKIRKNMIDYLKTVKSTMYISSCLLSGNHQKKSEVQWLMSTSVDLDKLTTNDNKNS